MITGSEINKAINLHNSNKLFEAEKIYKFILKFDNKNYDALHLLGALYFQLKKYDDSINLLKKAINSNKLFPVAYNTLGNVYAELKNYKKATLTYKKSIEQDSLYFEPYYNLANIYNKINKFGLAIKFYRKSLGINSESIDALCNLGVTYYNLNNFTLSLKYLDKAFLLNNTSINIKYNLAKTLIKIKRYERAIKLLSEVVNTPEYSDEKHSSELLLSHLGIISPPKKTSINHIKNIYKEHIDSWKSLKNINHSNKNYFGHKLIINLLSDIHTNSSKYNCLDIGCGTGIIGEYLKKSCSKITGVDISDEMLKVAKLRNVYDVIKNEDIENFLNYSYEKYDLIICSAVLIHYSDLSDIISLVSSSLHENGYLVVSLFTDNSAKSFSTDFSGFFNHNPEYVKKILNINNLKKLKIKNSIHEIRDGREILGTGYLYKKISNLI